MSWDLTGDHPPGAVAPLLRSQGFALLSAPALAAAVQRPAQALPALQAHWQQLPPDEHLRDGGRYRFRRHGCFVQDLHGRGELQPMPHRPHWQPTTYNALHGGMERWFAPLAPELVTDATWLALLAGLGRVFAQATPVPRWHIEAHTFRITTTDGVGRPTPEGAHRDGVDFVAVILVERHHVRGGETRVFDAAGPRGVRFTLSQPWSALLMDDARVLHETTPIQPEGDDDGHRDTLVLTYRAAGFQAPGAA